MPFFESLLLQNVSTGVSFIWQQQVLSHHSKYETLWKFSLHQVLLRILSRRWLYGTFFVEAVSSKDTSSLQNAMIRMDNQLSAEYFRWWFRTILRAWTRKRSSTFIFVSPRWLKTRALLRSSNPWCTNRLFFFSSFWCSRPIRQLVWFWVPSTPDKLTSSWFPISR